MDSQSEICEYMLDAYKVLIGEKLHLNGEGFDRLRREQRKDDEDDSQMITSDLSHNQDPFHDDTRIESDELEVLRRKKF